MARAKLDSTGTMLLFECPGCDMPHGVHVKPPVVAGSRDPVWQWNGSLETPTLKPSVLVRWTHGENHEHRCCHSFITDGRIQFLGDCTHALSGQTVDLPQME